MESLLDERDHLRVQISLATDLRVNDDDRLFLLRQRLTHVEGEIQQEQKNPNSWEAGDKPRR